MRQLLICIVGFLCFSLLFTTELYAGGLSTDFVGVKLQNLKPGQTYNVKDIIGKNLRVQNNAEDISVAIEIEPEKPIASNLMQGYEPIPDLSWIKINTNYFPEVAAGAGVETEITVTIPDDPQYYGKKYQVYIYSHTAGVGTFRVGLMSRILIETSFF